MIADEHDISMVGPAVLPDGHAASTIGTGPIAEQITVPPSRPVPPPPLLVGATDAGRLLGVSRSTFLRWDKRGILGPRSIKLGRKRLWVAAHLQAWALTGCLPRPRWLKMKSKS